MSLPQELVVGPIRTSHSTWKSSNMEGPWSSWRGVAVAYLESGKSKLSERLEFWEVPRLPSVQFGLTIPPDLSHHQIATCLDIRTIGSDDLSGSVKQL